MAYMDSNEYHHDIDEFARSSACAETHWNIPTMGLHFSQSLTTAQAATAIYLVEYFDWIQYVALLDECCCEVKKKLSESASILTQQDRRQ